MRILIIALFLGFFCGELTLDASTSFVRSGLPTTSSSVEVPSHSALPPVTLIEVPFVFFPELEKISEVSIPSLNPPRKRIERPPIS